MERIIINEHNDDTYPIKTIEKKISDNVILMRYIKEIKRLQAPNANGVPVISIRNCHLYLCDGNDESQCQHFRIIKRMHSNVSCHNCNQKVWSEQKKLNRRKEDDNSRTSPNSHTKLSSLTNDELIARCKNIKAKERKLKTKLDKGLKQLNHNLNDECIELDLEKNKNNQFKKLFSNIFSLTNTKTTIKNTILKLLLENEPMDATISEDIASKIDKFGDAFVEQIKNYSKKLKGKSQNCRFSPMVLKASLCHYLSNKQGYEDFQKSLLLIYPSIHTLKKMAKKLRVKEGNYVNTYSNFYDIFLKSEKAKGRETTGWLLYDEMKLKEGIFTNMHTGEMVGFSNNRNEMYDLKQIFSKVISTDTDQHELNFDKENKDKTVSYVKLWKFRSSYNQTRILEFYYNDGTLDKSNPMLQLFHILGCLNIIGVKVKGIISDAGEATLGYAIYYEGLQNLLVTMESSMMLLLTFMIQLA